MLVRVRRQVFGVCRVLDDACEGRWLPASMQRLLQILEDGVDSFVAGALGKVGKRDDASPPRECPFVGIAQAQPCPAVNHPLDLALQRPRVATKFQPVRRCEVVGLRIVEYWYLVPAPEAAVATCNFASTASWMAAFPASS